MHNRSILSIIATLIILSVTTVLSGQEENDLYTEGMSAYTSGSYYEAVMAWEKIASNNLTSPELFYNLGNAYFKTGDIPSSILYYEKALLLKPFDKDIRYNLGIAKTLITDKIDEIPVLFVVRWIRMTSLLFSSNKWAIVSISAFGATLILILVYLLSARYRLKKISFVGAIILAAVSAGSIAMSLENRSLTINSNYAIVFSQSVSGRSSPDNGGKDLFVIHEGIKVKIEDTIGEWSEITLPDGNVGWIESSSLRKI